VAADRAIGTSSGRRHRALVALAVLFLIATAALADAPNQSPKIDRIVIEKSTREMTLTVDA
jgi:hypothetical protein